jgi:hypothetical protein
MKLLMITWTDVFEGIGSFSQTIFKGMKALGHGPNIIIWIMIIGVLVYWTMRLSRYKKEAHRNGTTE